MHQGERNSKKQNSGILPKAKKKKRNVQVENQGEIEKITEEKDHSICYTVMLHSEGYNKPVSSQNISSLHSTRIDQLDPAGKVVQNVSSVRSSPARKY